MEETPDELRGEVATVSDLERWLVAVRGGRVLSRVAHEAYTELRESYAVVLEGKVAHVAAGAGDFGLGGMTIDCPEVDTRVIIGTNAYEDFDIESFAVELAILLLSSREDALNPAE